MSASASTPNASPATLARSLKNRHIQMIALGGAIGTGLFYGSAASIQLVGPGIILSYLIGGLAIYLIMRMLGEMSTQEPVSGAFSHFAYRYWGGFAGFLSGWNYWLLYVLVSMAELSVVGIYVSYWLPDFPAWASALIVLLSITALNLLNVRLYGESEFWLAFIKIAAIVGMIILGLLLIVLGSDQKASGLSNLWVHGGFLPNGIHGLLLSLVVVMFSFGGTELVGITAGEADDPQRSIPRAVNQVIWRILIFYIGALTVLVTLYPWNEVGLDGSPFVLIFSRLGIPAAPDILNLVVLSAAISVYNSGMYSNGRMLYSLAEQGNAPRIFLRLSRRQVPWVGILFSSACTLLIVVINFLVPEGAFMRIMAVATAAAATTWMMIVLVHLRFRRAHDAAQLHFPSPGFPWVNYLCAAFLVALVGLMTQLDDTRPAVYVLPVWLLVLYVGYRLRQRALEP
ncbi:MAG: amino acid permease [Castellaniella sp.]|uniref:amino acid permease n=1 Tax=Castellaniella sp. TaxID=1955812 RepID=UPI002A35D4C9|nr:amino acid permease [Castellaniella sp.]MDY0308472.1 amino acid permease [Castellaniella sp.]